MQYNYHTHTCRCNHAVGEEREYIENAIKTGIKVLGFSDHSPMIFSGNYYSTFRMTPSQTEDYIKVLTDLKREYESDIKIRIGFEMEYYPSCFERTLEFLSAYPYEYLILGQHALGDEEGEVYPSHKTSDRDTLVRYTEQVIEGMNTGRFLYLAHPDLINYTGDNELYRQEMSRLCKCARELDIPLEINLMGLQRNRNYPNPEFWRLASECGCTVTMGIDAHSPKDILSEHIKESGKKIADECSITLVQNLEDRFHE